MSRFLLIMSGVILLSFPVFSQGYSHIRNSDDAIIYIEINNFDELYELYWDIVYNKSNYLFSVETLIFSNPNEIANNAGVSKIYKIVESMNSTIKRLYFLNPLQEGNGFEVSTFFDIISILNNSSLQELRWEFQDKIEIKKFVEKIKEAESFWQELKVLSFKGTKLGTSPFIFNLIKFESLVSLDISMCGFERKHIPLILKSSQFLPKLETLNLRFNSIPFNHPKNEYKKQSIPEFNGLFPELKTIYFHRAGITNDLIKDFFDVNKEFVESLDKFYINQDYYEDKNICHDGVFEYPDKDENDCDFADSNLGSLTSLYLDSLSLKLPNKYYRISKLDNENLEEKIHNRSIKLCLFNQDDVNQMENRTPLNIEEVYFVGKFIILLDIKKLLDNGLLPKVKDVFVVSSSLNYSDLNELRLVYANDGIRFHFINFKILSYEMRMEMLRPNYLNEMWLNQQMKEMQEIQNKMNDSARRLKQFKRNYPNFNY